MQSLPALLLAGGYGGSRRLAPRRVLFWSPRSHRRFHALVLRHLRKGRQRNGSSVAGPSRMSTTPICVI